MKKVILVTNTDKINLLVSAGFTPCGSREVGNKTAYQFVVTDTLFKLLNDKSQFSKRDYVYDTKLTF